MAVEKMFGPLLRMPLKKVFNMRTPVENKRNEITVRSGLFVSMQVLVSTE
jgi:hypothetical protein